MGEMADFCNEHHELECFEAEEHRFSSHAERYERGLIDESGATIGRPSSSPFTPNETAAAQRAYMARTNPVGTGLCPKCGSGTSLRTGKYGKFYGCNNHPGCNGSRNA